MTKEEIEKHECELGELYDAGVLKGRGEATDKYKKDIIELLAKSKVLTDEVEHLKEVIKIMRPVL